jgi:hypothetical protein
MNHLFVLSWSLNVRFIALSEWCEEKAFLRKQVLRPHTLNRNIILTVCSSKLKEHDYIGCFRTSFACSFCCQSMIFDVVKLFRMKVKNSKFKIEILVEKCRKRKTANKATTHKILYGGAH